MSLSVREMVRAIQVEMRGDDFQPARAREMLVELTALYGNCLTEARDAQGAFNLVLLGHLDSGEPANRARIRAATSPEHSRLREADDTTKFVLESMRSLKKALDSIETEMRLAR